MSDDSTIIGKGSEILLPKSGNPFKKSTGSEDAPRDLTPDEVAARFGKAAPEVASSTGDLPADLSPADVAALFPSTQTERNAIPVSLPEETTPVYTPPPPPRLVMGQLQSNHVETTDDALSAFDPDASIEDAPLLGKADLPSTPIDIGTFNPDAPVGTDAETGIFLPVDSSMADSTSIKADAPLSESSLPPIDYSIGVVPLAPSASQPITDTLPPTVGINVESSPLSGAAESAPPPTTSAAPPSPTVKIDGSIVNVDRVDVSGRAAPGEPALVPDEVLTESAQPGKDLPTVPSNTLQLPLKEDAKLLKQLVTDDLVRRLWERIDASERRAIQDDSSLPAQRTANLDNLRTARNIILAGHENYEDALRYVAEVETDLLYAQRVRHWSYTYGIFVLIYDIVWILALAFGYSYTIRITSTYTDVVPQAVGIAIWVTLLAGGLGGVSKSLFSLYTHVSKGDFDRQFFHWYLVSPIAGAVLGVFVYVTAQMGITGVITAAQMGMASLSGETVAIAPVASGGFIMYGLAWVVGFQQNLVLRLVDRVVKLVFGTEEEKQESRKQKPPIVDKS